MRGLMPLSEGCRRRLDRVGDGGGITGGISHRPLLLSPPRPPLSSQVLPTSRLYPLVDATPQDLHHKDRHQ